LTWKTWEEKIMANCSLRCRARCLAGFGDGADDIQRLVTIEWRNLDGDNIFNLGELAPEL